MEELTAAAGGYTLVWYEEVDRVWRVTAGHHTEGHCSTLQHTAVLWSQVLASPSVLVVLSAISATSGLASCLSAGRSEGI